jgi:hypothetical protein
MFEASVTTIRRCPSRPLASINARRAIEKRAPV